jgi:hypothetical protein
MPSTAETDGAPARPRAGIPLEPPECPQGWSVAPPDFVGVGVHRSGTTWWHRLVTSHPGVSDPPGTRKELHFFDPYWDGAFGDADAERYRRYFPRPAGRLCGEWTPRYMYDAWVPRLLARCAPDAKLLVMLRDPLERYRSHMRIHMARVVERTAYSCVIAGDALSRSLYAVQLRRVLRHFPREQLLVLQFERCLAEPEAELRRTYEFLGLEPGFVPPRLSERVNPGPSEERLPSEAGLPDWLEEDVAASFADDVKGLMEIEPRIEIDLALWPSVSAAISEL